MQIQEQKRGVRELAERRPLLLTTINQSLARTAGVRSRYSNPRVVRHWNPIERCIEDQEPEPINSWKQNREVMGDNIKAGNERPMAFPIPTLESDGQEITIEINIPEQAQQLRDSSHVSEDKENQECQGDLSNDSSNFEMPQHIPFPKNLQLPDERSFELESQLLTEGLSLEMYKNFTQKKILNQDQRLETTDVLRAALFWILDLLYQNTVQVVFDIKRNFIKGDFEYIYKILASRDILEEFGGDGINQNAIKKLFIEFVYMKEDESTISLIQNYSILEPIIQLAMLYYIVCSLEPSEAEEFLDSYQSHTMSPKKTYETISRTFNLHLNSLNQKRFVIGCGDQNMTIKFKTDQLLESWIM